METSTAARVAVADEGVDHPTPHVVLADAFGELLDSIVAADSMIAAIQACKAKMVDQARLISEATRRPNASSHKPGWSAAVIARRQLASELAIALRIPERSAENLVGESELLVTSMPATLHALAAGDISYRHVQKLVDHDSRQRGWTARLARCANAPTLRASPNGARSRRRTATSA